MFIVFNIQYTISNNQLKAQSVGINATGVPPDTSAALDIDITTGGLLIPRLTTTQRNNIVSPAFSLMIFNLTDSCLQIYSGVNWENIYCLGDTACTPSTPGAITGNDTVCSGTAGEPYSIAAVSGAASYNWTVPSGATVASGQGTTSITIDFSSASGNVSVTASNSCGTSVATDLAITIIDSSTAPTAAAHIPSATQIVWNWNTVAGATGYKYNTVNDYATATDNGTSVTYTQTGLTCNTPDTLYVWAYNSCGNSSVTVLTQTTSACLSPPCTWNGDSTFTDARDGKIYNQVQIGTQCWMAENLDYGTYVTLATGQGAAGTQKYCYGDDTANCTTYGAIYEWAEMMDGAVSCNGTTPPPDTNAKCATPVQGICPIGWHVPSHYEWTLLEKNVGSNPGAFPYDVTTTGWLGTDEGGNLKKIDTTFWWNPNTGATNSSGFTALASGYANLVSDLFFNVFQSGYWWPSTEYSGTDAWARVVTYSDARIARFNYLKTNFGFSVRCVKD